jgi:hypothetical protein
MSKKYGAHELLMDLAAYAAGGMREGQPAEKLLFNIIHDFESYRKDREEPWWSPRTKGYATPRDER